MPHRSEPLLGANNRTAWRALEAAAGGEEQAVALINQATHEAKSYDAELRATVVRHYADDGALLWADYRR